MKYETLIVNDSSAGEMMKECYDFSYNIHNYRDFIDTHNDFPAEKPPIWIKLYKEKEFNSVNDFVHSVYDFIINDKVKNILEKYNLPIHDFVPVEVYRKEKTLFNSKLVRYEYHWFNHNADNISNYYDYIDFSKSEIGFSRNENIIDLKINSISDIYSIKESNKIITSEINELYKTHLGETSIINKMIREKDLYAISWRAEKIVFKENFDKELDLFSLPLFSSRTYISPRLKEALIENQVKDILFKETGNNPDRRHILNPKIEISDCY
ncbi:hypothetical protein [Flavobacterium wongokense]|uniref:hypothetical protein n=1 Tax=Flavobacterium wongokense TaxID=2910674 RepID=UPI001F2EA8C7|nr:hypothetical protein [Flavobacterium sp. WG47]MCF6133087.1 hypothetical protein [Flavobacterium sp. WG47]